MRVCTQDLSLLHNQRGDGVPSLCVRVQQVLRTPPVLILLAQLFPRLSIYGAGMGWVDVLPEFMAAPIRDAMKAPIRHHFHQFLNLGSESPVVVVLSGSMEPSFFRGDILFLNLGTAPVRTGEIVVYNADEKAIPVVHRIIQLHERRETDYVDMLTKGDNNPGNDRLLYVRGRQWLQKEHIVGRAVGFLPGVGMVTIVMNDYPWLKYSVIGLLGILCLLGIDE